MKITAPIISVREIAPMVRAGADELYFGLDLNKHTDDSNALNLYPTHLASFRSLASVQRAIAMTHQYGKAAFLCLNNEFYLKKQYALIYRILKRLKKLDSVVVSDILLIRGIRRRFPALKITASTRANIFNACGLEYFASLGVKRFVLPRDLYGDDIIHLLRDYHKYEFEIFMKNENCPYVNGLCTNTHNIWNEPDKAQLFCRDKRWSRIDTIFGCRDSAFKKRIGRSFQERLKTRNCGVCALPYLSKYDRGNIYLKLTGRMRSPDSSWKDAAFVKTALRLLPGVKSAAEFRKKSQNIYKKIYSRDCDRSCWYAFREY